VNAGGDAALLDGEVNAGRRAHVYARRDIDVWETEINAGRAITLEGRGDVSADSATIDAGRNVELKSSHGNVSAVDAWITAVDFKRADVKLDAAIDVIVERAHIRVNRHLQLRARDEVFANEAQLRACTRLGRVGVNGGGDIDLSDSSVRGFQKINAHSQRGDVNVSGAVIGILDGSRKGDIRVEADEIFVDDAVLLAPDRLILRGAEVGTPLMKDVGTLPCSLDQTSPVSTWTFTGPYDYYFDPLGNQTRRNYDVWPGTGYTGQQGMNGTLVSEYFISGYTNTRRVSWYEENPASGTPFAFVATKVKQPRSVLICPASVAQTLDPTKTHTVEVFQGTIVQKIDGVPVSGCRIEHS
jgi:hypothetical protein